MKFDGNHRDGFYVAHLDADIGVTTDDVGKTVKKSYSWLIKENSKLKSNYDPANKNPSWVNEFITTELGMKLTSFVSLVDKERQMAGIVKEVQGSNQSLKRSTTFNWPFQPAIFTDNQYTIVNDMGDYNIASTMGDIGLDLNHTKMALKALARLHAVTFAYFEKTKEREALQVMFDAPYQPSATADDKANAKEKLSESFDNLLRLVRYNMHEDDEKLAGDAVANRLQAKFGDAQKLYDLYVKALTVPSDGFITLCHGTPTISKFRFSYGSTDGTKDQPVNAKLVEFQDARYANAMTDLQIFMSTSLGDQVVNQADFLLRFIYHETLVSTLKYLKIDPPKNIIEFEVMQNEFKERAAFGILSGAMYLADMVSSPQTLNKPIQRDSKSGKKSSGKRVFHSKILGGTIGSSRGGSDSSPKGETAAATISTPESMVFQLVHKLI